MAEDVPLTFYQPAGLFLKQDAKICIEVKIPEIKVSGVSISNWEVMEKLKLLSQPEVFQRLRVVNYSRERIQFEGEFDCMRALRKVVLLLNRKSIKLSGFTDLLKVRAKQLDPEFPTKKDWEEFFVDRGVEKFDDARPGERPDTVHIKALPVKWFTSKTSDSKPCIRILTEAFQKFGKITQVDIYETPLTSSAQCSSDFASFGPGASQCLHFEAYIQYEKYAAFCTAMSSLRGVKMIRLEDGGKEAVASISVDFDRGAYLSERHMRKRRRAEEKRLKALEEQSKKEEQIKRVKEEKKLAEQRAAEEARAKRRARRLEEKQRKKEQQAMLVAQLKQVAIQRREEAQRLLSVLLAGSAEAKYQQEERQRKELLEQKVREEAELRRKAKLEEEMQLRNALMENVKQLEQRKQDIQRELLQRTSSAKGKIKSAIIVPK